MNETARLLIRADSKGVVKATSELDRLENQGKRTERATDGVGSSFKGIISAAAGLISVTAAVTKLTSVSREFGKLRASIETATGSAENGAIAFQAIQDFASETPFDLAQATDSFLKLVNLGLTPSERAMTSYGNTASALGKDLNQMIEAVADAATGEFERLKEFGIKAKNEGDTIKFTFQGVTTEVKNNAAAIEGYLMELGETKFAGQMERQMETLNGAISNFQDEFNKAFDNIGQAGAADIIEDVFRTGISALEEFNAQLASGQLEARIEAISNKFRGFAEDVMVSVDFITRLFEEAPEDWKKESTEAVDIIIGAFRDMPENIRAAIQLVTVEIASLVDYGQIYGQAMLDVIVLKFDQLAAEAKVYGQSISKSLNPFSDEYDFRGELDKVISEYSDKSGDIWKGAEQSAERAKQTRIDSITSILEERDTALESFDDQMSAADRLRAEWEKVNEERKADTTDKLAQFAVGGDSDSGGDESATSKEFDKLVKSLRTEEEAIKESYENRKKIIEENTQEESEARKRLMERLDEQRDQQYAKLAEDRMKDVENIRQSLLSEEEAMLESYERRREIILENEQLTEEQRQELLLGLQKDYVERTKELEQERMSAILQAGEKTFGSLAGLAKAFAGEQSDAYRAMFAVSQAFALTDATMKMYQAIQAAWASAPYPANLGPVAVATAETGANVAAIASQSFAGAYDEGGRIPTGKVGLVGEIGPELVSGPARVVGRKDTEKMMQESSQQQPVAPVTNIYNILDPSLIGDYMDSEDGETAVLNVIKNNPETVKSVASGG